MWVGCIYPPRNDQQVHQSILPLYAGVSAQCRASPATQTIFDHNEDLLMKVEGVPVPLSVPDKQ